MKVKVWQEKVVIPTYEIGKTEKNPMFLEKRVYQGSSGRVYPYPVIESISDVAVDKCYEAVFIENEYIKVMILPEIGGRVQMAYDKIKQRHFIYYNHVIKPALVGLTGPWISGGIEINWPQHHRPSTFLPVDCAIEELADGGVTVWVGERERMFHQKGMAGYTLRPGVARLEIRGQLYNPTPVPQTFLWWANPAVAVNDEYQSIFPPDVNAVFDHGRRDVSTFPIATGVYYKMDYSAGVDISRYRNIPVPTSYMAEKSKYDFVGGYEHDTRSGVLHVADHNVSPGKKQWTWGCGDFGKAWDRNLTDSDGPYIELMTGMYCDNQPDFAWLQPYEEKSFTQYFIPYRELGVVKNACADLFMNIEPADGGAVLLLFATRRLQIRACVAEAGTILCNRTLEMGPESVESIPLSGVKEVMECRVTIFDAQGQELLHWEREPDEKREIPSPAVAAGQPEEIDSAEQLFLTGQHLEQYRHATFCPTDYYREALRRDPSDIRNNNAMGLWLFRHGRFAEAEPYLRRAIATQTERNPNPYDGEPFYNLGQSLKFQRRFAEAYEAFYKSCWNGAWQGAGYLELARLSAAAGKWERALYEVDMSLSRNWHNLLARHLKCVVLRRLQRPDEALRLIDESLALDVLNTGCLFERMLLTEDPADRVCFLDRMRHESHNYEELALDYMAAGLWQEAVAVLECAPDPSPMNLYYAGYAHWRAGYDSAAKRCCARAETLSDPVCFPNRPEAILALQLASQLRPTDARAYYYLGNIWYDKLQYVDAVACWRRSVDLDASFPTSRRNLALACFNKLGRKEEALSLLEEAFRLDPSDARLFMELDQLHKRLNYPHAERLSVLERYESLVLQRDDLYLEFVTLCNQTGDYRRAISLIDARRFHPWEGGEGKVPAQYQYARMALALRALRRGCYDEVLRLMAECRIYPENLGEGKLQGAQENDFDYLSGLAARGLGDESSARRYFEAASKGLSEPSDAVYYNDQKPDKIFYQGLALQALGRQDEAEDRFARLIDYGERNRGKHVRIDYFAVSLPDLQIWEGDLDLRNNIHCDYMEGLGWLGRGDKSRARFYLSRACEADNNHQGAQMHLSWVYE